MIKVGQTHWYSLAEASQIIVKDRFGNSVKGIHSESLRRTHRQFSADPRNPEVAKRIGRDLFFRESDLKTLGYDVSDDTSNWFEIREVIQLFPEEKI